MSNTDEIEDSSAPLIEHLAELRNRLMWALGALVVCILVLFPFANTIFDFLANPACTALKDHGREECDFIAIGAQNIFLMNVSVSIFAGFWEPVCFRVTTG